MKIFEIFNKKTHKWNQDSFDVWISNNGQVIDLGSDTTHLGYVQENFKINSTEYLIENGWIKITNTSNTVEVFGKYDSLKQFKNLWIKPILEKSNVTVYLNNIGKNKKIFVLPNDQIKFLLEI